MQFKTAKLFTVFIKCCKPFSRNNRFIPTLKYFIRHWFFENCMFKSIFPALRHFKNAFSFKIGNQCFDIVLNQFTKLIEYTVFWVIGMFKIASAMMIKLLPISGVMLYSFQVDFLVEVSILRSRNKNQIQWLI